MDSSRCSAGAVYIDDMPVTASTSQAVP